MRRKHCFRSILFALPLALFLAGCGQKGPLKLPTAPPAGAAAGALSR